MLRTTQEPNCCLFFGLSADELVTTSEHPTYDPTTEGTVSSEDGRPDLHLYGSSMNPVISNVPKIIKRSKHELIKLIA